MGILCLAEDSHEISSLIFSEKKKKKKYARLLPAAVVIGALKVKAVRILLVEWQTEQTLFTIFLYEQSDMDLQ